MIINNMSVEADRHLDITIDEAELHGPKDLYIARIIVKRNNGEEAIFFLDVAKDTKGKVHAKLTARPKSAAVKEPKAKVKGTFLKR
jgi:hypothetical protein